MAELRRSIRCAQIEYQPNLERPADPFPLGVVVEEGSGEDRRVILLGRFSLDGVDLGNAWGPFREVVTNWFDAFSRSIDELIKTAGPNASVIDGLARQWRSNVYVKQPETKVAASKTDLDKVAGDCYEAFVGEKVSLPGDRSQAKLKRARANYMERATV